MRRLSDYTALQTLKGDPLVHGFKRIRNLAVDHGFRRMRAPGRDRFLEQIAPATGGTLALSIAFQSPPVIDCLVRSCRANLTDTTLAILDNSKSLARAREIEAICRDADVPYLKLPRNPEWHPCRSHGIALNWGYHNIVRAVRPKTLALLDHDLFPTRPVDLSATVRDQPVYGMLHRSRWGAYVWAGFTVFDMAAVGHLPLDFNNDLPRRLDTGGQNWKRLYRHLDLQAMNWAHARVVDIQLPGDDKPWRTLAMDDFVHVSDGSGANGGDPNRVERYRRLVDAVVAGQQVDRREVTRPAAAA